MPADPMHDTESAAKFLGLAPHTLENMRHRGGGPVFQKLGRSVRYRESELIRYRDAATFARTHEPVPAGRRAS